MTDNTQPEALRLAERMSSNTGHVGGPTMDATASELRRQHARIAELEAQLSSSGFTAADTATAEARGFRDGVTSVAASAPAPSGHIKEPYTVAEIKAKIASNDYSAELLLQHAMLHLERLAASAGSEPVALNREALIDVIAQGLHGTWHCNRVWEAWHVGTMSQDDFEPVDESETPAELADAVLALLTHPSPPEGMVGEGWVPIETAPKDGKLILVNFKSKGVRAVSWDSPFHDEVTEENGIWCVDDDKHGPYGLRGYNDDGPTAPPPLDAPSSSTHHFRW